jgi:bifunctional non-homologous end joining protein LigD
MPERIAPMLARTGDLPRDDENWAYEIKWDGVRAIAYVGGGSIRLEARSGRDITPRYPELRGLARALGSSEAVLDGEVVAFHEGRPSFQKLQGRMHLTSEHHVRRLSQSDPVNYVIFDLLWLDGHSLMDLTYVERRERLLELGLGDDRWQSPAHHVGDGAAMLDASRAQGLEGIIAKRLDCPYTPGKRSHGWVKVKNVLETDVVVGGWLPGEGRRATQFGALVVGVYADGELKYAGRVGTGFNERELTRLGAMLAERERDGSPFGGRQPPEETRFVEPVLVARVGYGEWTQAGTLRHPRYLGLRDDIDPETVEREET